MFARMISNSRSRSASPRLKRDISRANSKATCHSWRAGSFGSLAASTPYLAVILAGIVFMWLKAAKELNVMFEDAMAASGAE